MEKLHIYLLYNSLSVFIVSDCEESNAASDEDSIHSGLYDTPCTPASGVMFWGSPYLERIPGTLLHILYYTMFCPHWSVLVGISQFMNQN